MEPITTTVIVTLAFTKFLETSVEKFTEAGLQKIDQLREKIWNKLRGNPKAEQALSFVEKGSKGEVSTVVSCLDEIMARDPQYANELRALARQIINIGAVEGENWNVFDGVVYYNKDSKAPIVQGNDNTVNVTYNQQI